MDKFIKNVHGPGVLFCCGIITIIVGFLVFSMGLSWLKVHDAFGSNEMFAITMFLIGSLACIGGEMDSDKTRSCDKFKQNTDFQLAAELHSLE